MDDELRKLLDLPDRDPQIDVYGHLHGALDRAGDEFASLNPLAIAYVEALAEWAIGAKRSVIVQPDQEVGLDQAHELLQNAWFRHGAEIALARGAVDRGAHAISRWLDLEPIVTAYPIPESALEYATELTQTYLYGFDAACIAFCSAALEQVLRDALLRVGEYTEPRLRKEKPTAHTLVAKSRQRSILVDTVDAAETVALHRNKVMHQRPWESGHIRSLALGCIERFAQVVGEIERRVK